MSIYHKIIEVAQDFDQEEWEMVYLTLNRIKTERTASRGYGARNLAKKVTDIMGLAFSSDWRVKVIEAAADDVMGSSKEAELLEAVKEVKSKRVVEPPWES